MASLNSSLQAMIKLPRKSSDPRIAKTTADVEKREKGMDGKTYVKVSVKDYGKYKVLSDAELEMEQQRALSLAATIRSSSASSSSDRQQHRASSSSPVMVGTASRSKRTSHRAWTAELNEMSGAGSKTAIVLRESTSKDAINSSSSSSSSSNKVSPRSSSPAYQSNLISVSEELRREARGGGGAASSTAAAADDDDVLIGTLQGEQDAPPPSFAASSSSSSSAAAALGPPLSSSMEPPTRGSYQQQQSSSSQQQRQRPSSAFAPKGGRGGVAASADQGRRGLEEGEGMQQARRSMSAGGGGRGSSPSKLLDYSSYMKRKQDSIEREAAIKKHNDDWVAYLQQRTLRASVNGKEFTKMMVRAQVAEDKNKQRMMKKKQKEDEAERAAAEERTRKMREHLNKQLSKTGDLSWAEIEAQNNAKREENAEKRKAELALMSSAPAGAFKDETQKKLSRAAKQAQEKDENFLFKAEDPSKIAARLAKQQEAWQKKLEAAKEKLIQDKVQRQLSETGKPLKSNVAAMEERAKTAEIKRAARLAEKQKVEDAKAKAKEDEEKAHMEKLFNAKLPESGRRMTKSTENRAKNVRDQIRKEQEAKEKANREMERKAQKEREMAAQLKVQIAERNAELRAKVPGFVELQPAETLQEKAAEAKRNFLLKLNENKAKLAQVYYTKPTLLERHTQSMATKSAAAQALEKCANAIKGAPAAGGGGGKSKAKGGAKKGDDEGGYDDFFSADENLKLSARNSAV